jgi:hypothetical protein
VEVYKLGWVDVGTTTRVPLRFVASLSKGTIMSTEGFMLKILCFSEYILVGSCHYNILEIYANFCIC